MECVSKISINLKLLNQVKFASVESKEYKQQLLEAIAQLTNEEEEASQSDSPLPHYFQNF